MSLRKFSLLAAFAFAVLGQSAQAAFISQVQSYGPSTTPFADPLTFNSFDPTLGTLTGVTIKLTENGTVTANVINLSPGTSSFTNANSTGTVSVTGPDATTVAASFTTAGFSGTVSGIGTTMQVGATTGSATTTTSVASSNFVSYEGASPLNYTIFANGSVMSTGTSASGAVAFYGTASLSGTVEIDYTYTAAVPEPASFAMVALGLGGLAVVRRVRRRAV